MTPIIYFKDTDYDGGWNHGEVRRFTRIYEGEDRGKFGYEIQTPMKYAGNKIRTWYSN